MTFLKKKAKKKRVLNLAGPLSGFLATYSWSKSASPVHCRNRSHLKTPPQTSTRSLIGRCLPSREYWVCWAFAGLARQRPRRGCSCRSAQILMSTTRDLTPRLGSRPLSTSLASRHRISACLPMMSLRCHYCNTTKTLFYILNNLVLVYYRNAIKRCRKHTV